MLAPSSRALLVLVSAAGALSAQVTTDTIFVGGPNGLGCQGQNNAAVLSQGTAATAQIDLTYDADEGELIVEVSNTSPVTAGVPNPVLTTVAFNLPFRTTDEVELESQRGSGGATPRFHLAFDPDITTGQSLMMGCFGDFSVKLDTKGIRGGIANPLADTWSVPAGSLVTGPVRFELELEGPGVPYLTAQIIADAFSASGPVATANAVCFFQGGGPSGTEGGYISNGEFASSCLPNTWITGRPQIGTRIGACISLATSCHGCLAVSMNPNPVQIGPVSLPLGLPLLLTVAFQLPPGQNTQWFPVVIPNEPTLVGTSLYMTMVTPGGGSSSRSLLEFSPRFDVTFISE